MTRPDERVGADEERGAASRDGQSAGADDEQPAPHVEHISTFEWLVAALGLLLVVAAVAFMVVEATRGGSTPPRIRVRADSVVATGDGGYLVQFTAANRGHETAADVAVVGELRDAAGVETSRARVDYLPGRSERRGGLLFHRDPRQAALRLWAEGYQEP